LQVNYAQNIDQIQALEGLVSIFGNGAMCIVGGNWRIFNEMIIDSGAEIHLNSPIFAIDKSVRDGKTVWEVSSNEGTETFDSVVLASPYVSSCI
jgi:prenylcysteine oxidase / farnesylcysteine lyase